MSITPRAPIGIMAALLPELQALLAAMPHQSPERVAGREFWRGTIAGQPVVAVLSGIGKVAAACTASVLCHHHGVGALLFTGVAGGLAPQVQVGDVVVATHLLQHDMDASPLFPRYEIPLTGRSHFGADAAWADALHGGAQHALALSPELLQGLVANPARAPQVHRGLIVSGDRFVSSATESQALTTALPEALAVEMEGAAVAQVAHDFGVPLAVVRSISDRADDSAHVDFNRFVHQVASPLALRLLQLALQSRSS